MVTKFAEFDLLTLDLPSGTHTITVKSKADGYSDSEPSNAVTVYVVGGTWVFNETITFLSSHEVKFTSNGKTFSTMYSGTVTQTLIYSNAETSVDVYDHSSDKWIDESYRTITFTENQIVSKDFYEWLTENATRKVISFTINGTTYQTQEGMTWGEWVKSEYNVDGYYLSGTAGAPSGYYIDGVKSEDIIIEANVYTASWFEHSGGSN